MNATDRQFFGDALLRGTVMLQTGDREGTIHLLRRLRIIASGQGAPVDADGRFYCARLDCALLACVCVKRQVESDAQRTRQTNRGEASDFPLCVTSKCEQGRGLRMKLGTLTVKRTSKSERGGFHRSTTRRSAQARAQEHARQRLESEGMLDEVRTIDVDADASDER